MSLHPVAFYADGSIDVVFDELGHSGTLAPTEIVWSKQVDGTDNHKFIELVCPDGCGAMTAHPVGGGAAPFEVQQMFVHKTERDGCACGQIAAGRSDGVPESHVRLNCNRMDGTGRWQLDQAPQVVTQAGKPFNFQVVYDDTDGLIVGLEPAGGVGRDLAVAVLHDQAEYDALLRYEPAYLTADKAHIVATPQP